jgi:hypothetical protein
LDGHARVKQLRSTDQYTEKGNSMADIVSDEVLYQSREAKARIQSEMITLEHQKSAGPEYDGSLILESINSTNNMIEVIAIGGQNRINSSMMDEQMATGSFGEPFNISKEV